MGDHDREKYRIKPWERALESTDQTPGDGKINIAGIVNLAAVAVPTISQKRGARRMSEEAWILECLPWELGKRVADHESIVLHGAESICKGLD